MKRNYLVLPILGLALALRLYAITAPLVDVSSWRQTDTATMARNFAYRDFNILHPQLDYDGPGPNYVELELQIAPFLAAILYRLFGFHDFIGRLLSVLFFVGAVYLFQRLAERYSNRSVANTAAAVLAVLPLGIYYGRAVQPESAMLFFGLAALLSFSRWTETERWAHFALAVLLGALAFLAKLPNLFILLPLVALAIQRFGIRALRDWRLLIYMLVSVGAVVGYYYYLHGLVLSYDSPYDYHDYSALTVFRTGAFVTNIVQNRVFPEFWGRLSAFESWEFLRRSVVQLALTPLGMVLLVLGLFLPPGERKTAREARLLPLDLWALAMLAYALTVVIAIRFDYYLVPALPVAAFYVGRGIAFLREKTRVALVVPAFVVLILAQGVPVIGTMYARADDIYTAGRFLERSLRPGAVVIYGDYNPALLYYSGHRGWRTRRLDVRQFQFLLAQGAGYYVPLRSAEPQLLELLDRLYERQEMPGGMRYYDLSLAGRRHRGFGAGGIGGGLGRWIGAGTGR